MTAAIKDKLDSRELLAAWAHEFADETAWEAAKEHPWMHAVRAAVAKEELHVRAVLGHPYALHSVQVVVHEAGYSALELCQ